jgi:hypothetical protein
VWSGREEERFHCDGRRGIAVAAARIGGETAISDGREKDEIMFVRSWCVVMSLDVNLDQLMSSVIHL